MSKQGDAAYAWLLKGYNCSQSVVAAFAPQTIIKSAPVRSCAQSSSRRTRRGGTAFTGRMRKCGLSNWN
mgnify:CR=1 FL=1|jgi:hypothetical protein